MLIQMHTYIRTYTHIYRILVIYAYTDAHIYTNIYAQTHKHILVSRIYIGRAEKSWKFLATILVVWQLLSGFCLTHPMLCDIKEKGSLLLWISKWLRRENRVKAAVYRAEHKVGEVANLVGLAQSSTPVLLKLWCRGPLWTNAAILFCYFCIIYTFNYILYYHSRMFILF